MNTLRIFDLYPVRLDMVAVRCEKLILPRLCRTLFQSTFRTTERHKIETSSVNTQIKGPLHIDPGVAFEIREPL